MLRALNKAFLIVTELDTFDTHKWFYSSKRFSKRKDNSSSAAFPSPFGSGFRGTATPVGGGFSSSPAFK
jgi:hypothetical protein